MVQPEQLVEAEWAEWYLLTPAERWLESEKLWEAFLMLARIFRTGPFLRLLDALTYVCDKS